MARLILIAALLGGATAAPPVRAQAPPGGTAPAPKRAWDYRSDGEIRAARGFG